MEDEKPDPLLEEAMDWLLRLQDAPRDPDIARQFDVWHSRSADHARAWNKARKTWQLMGEVPPVHEHLWNNGRAAGGRSISASSAAAAARGWGWKGWAGGAVAAVLAVFLILAVPTITLRMQADYMTATAENRVVTLKDGSTVTLGADSAVAAQITDTGRRITLLSGEAFFEVARDTSRPFVVTAGGVDVTALGTAFNVQLSEAAATIELAKGSVGVDWEQAPGRDAAVLAPGEMIVVDRRTGEMVRSTIAQDDIAAWRSGKLFVNAATIGSVVEQLQRYHTAWIKVPDSQLAAERVTGLYDLHEPDRALRALVEPYGGQVRTFSPYLRVLSRF